MQCKIKYMYIGLKRVFFSILDQNECDTANGGCSQNCMNTEGSFYCTCNSGYKLNADKRQCDGEDKFI